MAGLSNSCLWRGLQKVARLDFWIISPSCCCEWWLVLTEPPLMANLMYMHWSNIFIFYFTNKSKTRNCFPLVPSLVSDTLPAFCLPWVILPATMRPEYKAWIKPKPVQTWIFKKCTGIHTHTCLVVLYFLLVNIQLAGARYTWIVSDYIKDWFHLKMKGSGLN